MDDLISVVVPVYNVEKYLEQCILSIINQTYVNLQIILVDDGSTDMSGSICEEFAKCDKRISVIHQDNKGLVGARKAGLEIAAGEYIGFVDSDDYIDHNMYFEMHRVLKEQDVDFVQTGMYLDEIESCGYDEQKIVLNDGNRDEIIKSEFLEKEIVSLSIWSKLYRAELAKRVYAQVPDEQSFGEDMLFICGCLIECGSIYLYKRAFYHYRIVQGSLSHREWEHASMEEGSLCKKTLLLLERYGMTSTCGDGVMHHYRQRVLGAILSDESNGIYRIGYTFRNVARLRGKRVALYGASAVGKDFYIQFMLSNCCDVVAWVDKVKTSVGIIPIAKPLSLKQIEYDVIVIAVKKESTAREIENELITSGCCSNSESVIWESPLS
jgi:glycosyltransferase involved in cell wall biosynthesis